MNSFKKWLESITDGSNMVILFGAGAGWIAGAKIFPTLALWAGAGVLKNVKVDLTSSLTFLLISSGILGSTTGLALGLWGMKCRRAAGLLCLATGSLMLATTLVAATIIVALATGATTIDFAAMMVSMVVSEQSYSPLTKAGLLSGLLMFWYGPSVWSALLMLWGWHLRRSLRRFQVEG